MGMIDHDRLRILADSFGLLFLIAVLLAALWMTFRPSARAGQEAAKMIPLNDGD